MAERHSDGDSMERAETVDPRNPPNSVAPHEVEDVPKSAAGVAGMWYVLGPIVLLLVVLGIGIFFWADDGDADADETPIGTAGETADEQTPGGGDPDAPSSGTENEVETRGGKGN